MPDTHLGRLIEAELSRQRGWRLRFAPAVEARFEVDGGAARRRSLVLAGLFGLGVYNCFILNDWFVRRAEFASAVAWRSVLTVYGATVLIAVARQWVGPVWRERLMASTLMVTMVCSCVIFRFTGSEVRTYDTFAFSLIFLAGNISFPLRFAHALTSSLACLAVAAFYIVIDDRMPEQARIFAMALLAGTVVFTVQACYSIECSTRQSYLLRLRETLASQAARRRADVSDRLAQTDALTSLPNRRAFDLALPGRLQAATAADKCLALVLIDVDHFKQYNDLYGHPAGDACLRRLGEAMRAGLPHEAFLARIGGEEFVALVACDSDAECRMIAERLRDAVEALAIPHANATGSRVVTISLGVALCPPGADLRSEAMVASADAALYKAKHGGRNRCAQASNVGDLSAVR